MITEIDNEEIKTEGEGTEIVPFSKLKSGLAKLKGEYLEVPDCKTKSGYNVVKSNLKEYRNLKKQVEDIRVRENKDLLKRQKGNNKAASDIMVIVDDIFEPHKQAKLDEDERLAIEKQERADALERREKEIRGQIDDIKEMYFQSVTKTAKEVSEGLAELLAMEIDDKDFGDFKAEALAIKSAITSKLMDLHNSKKTEEETAAKLKEVEEKLKLQQEQQRIEDEKRQKEVEDKAEADRLKLEKENKDLQARLDAAKAKEKELEEKEQKILEKEKEQKAKDERLKEMAIEKEAEKKRKKEEVKRLEEEKKTREKAEKEAEKEAGKRREEFIKNIESYVRLAASPDVFIKAIENEEIPYLRLDFTKK